MSGGSSGECTIPNILGSDPTTIVTPVATPAD